MIRANTAIFLLVMQVLLAGCLEQRASSLQPSYSPPTPTRTLASLTSSTEAHAAARPSPDDAIASAPLSSAAIASCPVTLPNGESPPDEAASRFEFGNEDRTIFASLWPGGKVIFTPNGPGARNADGSLGMKWPWYRTIPGDVWYGGTRLDGWARPMLPQVLRGQEDGYGETGSEPGGLLFTSPGCWEVTARLNGHELSFVTLAVLVAFDPPEILWWPVNETVAWTDTVLVDYPDAIEQIFAPVSGGQIRISTAIAGEHAPTPVPAAEVRSIVVNGRLGTCVRGQWDEDQGSWSSDANASSIEWASGGLWYRISQAGLGLDCATLGRMMGEARLWPYEP